MIETIISIQKYDIYNICTHTETGLSISIASDVYIYKQYWLKNLWGYSSTKEVKYQKYYNIQKEVSKNYTIVLLGYYCFKAERLQVIA